MSPRRHPIGLSDTQLKLVMEAASIGQKLKLSQSRQGIFPSNDLLTKIVHDALGEAVT
jgi:hypothetical protein